MPLPVVSPRSRPMPVVRVLGTLLAMGCLAGFLSACGSSSRGGGGAGVAQRGTYKVGAPYKIDGVTYTPQEEFNRTETGVASWYGPGFHGKSTANGERYDQSDRTAAHREGDPLAGLHGSHDVSRPVPQFTHPDIHVRQRSSKKSRIRDVDATVCALV